MLAATRNSAVLGLVLPGFAAIVALVRMGFSPLSLLIVSLCLLLTASSLAQAIVAGLFQAQRESDLKLWRLLARLQISALFRQRELKSFSSMTSFLVSLFLVFLVFSRPISTLCLAFVTVGDLFAKLIGVRFGTVKLLEGRTLEGALGFLAGSLCAGTILSLLLPIDLHLLLVGAPSASLVEVFSRDLDENFTVGIVTGGYPLRPGNLPPPMSGRPGAAP